MSGNSGGDIIRALTAIEVSQDKLACSNPSDALGFHTIYNESIVNQIMNCLLFTVNCGEMPLVFLDGVMRM